MEIASSIEPFTSPRAPFLGDPLAHELASFCQREYDSRHRPNTSEFLWASSVLNPRNRLNSLAPRWQTSRWRIDGCSAMGRQFFALPIHMLPDLPVKDIKVTVPCQSLHPHALRRSLRSYDVSHTPRDEIGELEISRYIAQALELWSSGLPYFDEIYRNIPFGSVIVLEELSFHAESARFRFVARSDLDRHLVPLEYLRAAWDIPLSAWPPVIPVTKLTLLAQLTPTVSVVKLPESISRSPFVFKTNPNDINRVYHELKILLIMEPHESIIGKPRYIVQHDDATGSSPKVLGFLLDYVQGQTLGDALDQSAPIPLSLKMNWATELITALLHVTDGPCRFYSDLKPDNILIRNPSQDILLIDMEQGGNWDTFSAPEVLYISCMKKLAADVLVPEDKRIEYKSLLLTNLPAQTRREASYDNPPHGYYDEWTNLTPEQQESAMVFATGKILWCIFEECSHTSNSPSEKYTKRADTEFPAFRKTPQKLRGLIRRCTLGAPEWDGESVEARREGCMLFTRSRDGQGRFTTEESPVEILSSLKRLWEARLHRMEAYVRARARWIQGTLDAEDDQVFGFTKRRPRLGEVLHYLQEFAQTESLT